MLKDHCFVVVYVKLLIGYQLDQTKNAFFSLRCIL